MPAGTRRNRCRSNDERYRTRRRVRRRVHPRFPGTKKWVVPPLSCYAGTEEAHTNPMRQRRSNDERYRTRRRVRRRVHPRFPGTKKWVVPSALLFTAWECRLVSKPREYVHLLTERLLALTDDLDLVGDLLALDDEGDLGTVEGKSHRVRLLKVFVNYFSYNHRRLDGLIENGVSGAQEFSVAPPVLRPSPLSSKDAHSPGRHRPRGSSRQTRGRIPSPLRRRGKRPRALASRNPRAAPHRRPTPKPPTGHPTSTPPN